MNRLRVVEAFAPAYGDERGPFGASAGPRPRRVRAPSTFNMARPFLHHDRNATMTVDEDVARLRFDSFELDEADARLTRAGQPVPLPPKPFAVLCTLARSPGRLVTKNVLLDSVWGHRFVTESALKTAISEVRAALGDDPKQPRYIETVSRRGYRFIAD